jgi:signal transduction histidine kinase
MMWHDVRAGTLPLETRHLWLVLRRAEEWGAMASRPRDEFGVESPETAQLDRPPKRGVGSGLVYWTRVTAAGVSAIVVVVWLILILGVSEIRFVIVAPTARAGFEVFLALLQLSAALVLFLFPAEVERPRLRWVSLGFMILGLGGLVFGYLYSAAGGTVDFNEAMYGSVLTQSLAALVISVGLFPRRPPAFSLHSALVPLAAFAILSAAIIAANTRLPTLVMVDDLEAFAAASSRTLASLTGWHWGLSLIPLIFAVAAAVGAARHYPGRVLGGWLVVAMVLMAGSQLHTLFWPSGYRPVLTTSSLLRVAFTAVVAVGSFLELRRVAAERATSLAEEREYVERLEDLAQLRADFTAIVAHELGNPIGTVVQAAELLATGPLDPIQTRAVAAINASTTALTALVADVRAAADAERDDFAVRPLPVPVRTLLGDTTAYAMALPGNHPMAIEDGTDVAVRADRMRIGQVVRNLLTNAAKYSPPGTPITLRTARRGGHVRIEVVDRGYGIHADDLPRIFEKFGRGRDVAGEKRAGVGLGLYLSRRIVRAHGSDLTVDSTPGLGCVFGFELEVVP